jgi:hypothetical protein
MYSRVTRAGEHGGYTEPGEDASYEVKIEPNGPIQSSILAKGLYRLCGLLPIDGLPEASCTRDSLLDAMKESPQLYKQINWRMVQLIWQAVCRLAENRNPDPPWPTLAAFPTSFRQLVYSNPPSMWVQGVCVMQRISPASEWQRWCGEVEQECARPGTSRAAQ